MLRECFVNALWSGLLWVVLCVDNIACRSRQATRSDVLTPTSQGLESRFTGVLKGSEVVRGGATSWRVGTVRKEWLQGSNANEGAGVLCKEEFCVEEKESCDEGNGKQLICIDYFPRKPLLDPHKSS